MNHFLSIHPEIFDRLHDAVISTDANGEITAFNLAAVNIFEYKDDELIGVSISDLFPKDQHAAMEDLLEKVRFHGSCEGEFLNRTKTGKNIWVHVSVSLLKLEEDVPFGMIFFAIDITDRKHIEEELTKTRLRASVALQAVERQAAAAKMGSALAHEINNPLAALTNALYLFRHSEFGLTHQDLVGSAEESLERVTRITRQMIGLSSESEAVTEVRLNEIVLDTLATYHSTIHGKQLRVQNRVEIPEGKFVGVESDFRRLIASLIENAVEHTQPQGAFNVRIYPAHEWTNGRRDGVRIVVQDSGPGIPSEILPNIFDAFYSTKEKKGSGLGLWTSRSIIEKHGGLVRVRSSTRPGFSGTCISVFLPDRRALQRIQVVGAVAAGSV